MQEAFDPVCVRLGYNQGRPVYDVLGNACYAACVKANDPSLTILARHLRLPAVCKAQFKYDGAIQDASCFAHCRTGGLAADAAPQLTSRRALKSPGTCQQQCAAQPFAPVCARLGTGRTSYSMAFPNPCFVECASSVRNTWVIVGQLHLPAQCAEEYQEMGYMTGTCIDC